MQNTVLQRTARAIFYIVSIGGLLFCSSGTIWALWNMFLSKYQTIPDLSMLEAAGLVAVAYVITSGIQSAVEDDTDKPSRMNPPQFQRRPEMAEKLKPEKHFVEESCKNMTPEQRKALVAELGKCCGKVQTNALKTDTVLKPITQEEHIG